MYPSRLKVKKLALAAVELCASKYALAAVLIFLIAAGFLLRMNIFDATGTDFYHVDVARDHLIASHIVQYGDFPLTGPDGYFGKNGNSPVYYYIIAGLLLLHNFVLFPGIVNVILQAFAILLVFILGKELFGKRTGLGAALLFTFFDGVVMQAMHMWQPHLMQFFLLLSFVFLVYGYKKDKDAWLYASAGLIAFSAVLHNSVLALLPLQLCVIIYILWKRRKPVIQSIAALGIAAGVFLASYIPVFYYLLQMKPTERGLTPYDLLHELPDIPDPSLPQILTQAAERAVNLFTYLFEGSLTGATAYTYACIFLFLSGSLWYAFYIKDKKRRASFFLLWAGLLCVAIGVGSLKLADGGFPIRYYTPVFVPFLILTAEIIRALSKKLPASLAVYAAAVLCVALVGSEYVRSRFEAFPAKVSEQGISVLYPQYTWPEDVTVLAEEIIKRDPSMDFDIRTFENDYEHIYKNELVFLPLELMLHRQLVHIDTATFRGYAVMDDPEHMFIRCIEVDVKKCAEQFMEKYSKVFSIESVIYEGKGIAYLYARKI